MTSPTPSGPPSDFDYIIVGAGSAGCVLANRLSADPARRVLLLESGPPDGGLFMSIPRGVAKLFSATNPQVAFYEAKQGGNGGSEYWLKGRTIGGSSSINGMVYTRGMPSDYDRWEALGCRGWGWDTIGARFVELEDHVLGAAAFRGVGGPLRISINQDRSDLSRALLAAARDQGAPTVADINDVSVSETGGFGYQTYTIRKGRRFSAASAFLTPARRRPNLTVMTDSAVLRVNFEGARATGVTVRTKGELRTLRARETILTAGAIETPKLLQLSGVGPGALLRSLGIEVVADAPEVGRNLVEHRYFALQYRVVRGSSNAAQRGAGLLGSVLRYALGRRGPLARGTFDLGGFIKTDPGLEQPDAQVGLGLYTLRTDRGRTETWNWPGISIGGYFLRPESRGYVQLQSADADAPPLIDANYFAEPADRAGAIGLFRWIQHMAEQPALAAFGLKRMTPEADVTGDDEIIEAILKTGSSGFHVAGTCRMGSDPASVVDPDLRVRGVSGLRIADTSIMPTMVSGNTNGPMMAVALAAADRIVATA